MENDLLISAAWRAREQAYAPYSHFPVGAAALTHDGQVVTGANVENLSFGLTICAERVALATAITSGVQPQAIRQVVVVSEKGYFPCGACRQVMVEFARDVPVYLVDVGGNGRDTTLHTLLPDHFGPEHLT